MISGSENSRVFSNFYKDFIHFGIFKTNDGKGVFPPKTSNFAMFGYSSTLAQNQVTCNPLALDELMKVEERKKAMNHMMTTKLTGCSNS
ncbi:hypothetical protein Bca4012_019484 [Brassica carinata]